MLRAVESTRHACLAVACAQNPESSPVAQLDERDTRLNPQNPANLSILRESRTEASLLRPPQARHKGRDQHMPGGQAREANGREGSGMSTQAGAFRCQRIRPRDAVPDGAYMCAGATDVKAVGHKTLHLTRRTKTSLDCTKLGRNPRPAEPTAGLS